MKVYVLSFDLDYGNWEVKGVYSTNEKAERALDILLTQGEGKTRNDFKIEEFEVE